MRVLFVVFAVLALAALPASAQEKPTPAKSSSTKAAAPTSSSPVNLNTATQAQLESLPGLGPKVAQRILEYRQKNGNFKKIEDVMNVKGIGEKSFLKLKPLLTVTQKADPAGSPSR